MASRKCPACGEPYRKGKRRVILHFDGSIGAAYVCPACVGRSVSLVTPFPRAGLTVQGVELLQRVSDRLRSQAHAASLMLPHNSAAELTKNEQYTHGRYDALCAAVELVQRAIAGIEP
jgi:hypothetical protein